MAQITIPKTIEGLEYAASQILSPKTSEPVVEAIKTRKRWRDIKRDYKILRKTMKSDPARRKLSEKYYYSEKTIQAILYDR